MLSIRKEQMQALREVARERFVKKMMTHLRRDFSEQTRELSEKELRDLVDEGMEQASEYDLEMRNDVRRYLECVAVYGPGFDTKAETAWAGRILRDNSLSGTRKMDRIADYETFARRT